ncbi:MAG: PhzF family phenazine biosynthesis protein [Acidobacteria bacterium]|nr:PhzF family phenazine biosynthesis protein [Acidobacteriota bacterium]
MHIPFYHVDAFTSRVFAGNPAGVCILERWPGDADLQAIAAENNLPETAFLLPDGGGWELRWFSPTTEVALCGHATLAAAFVLFSRRGVKEPAVRFTTRHSGRLTVRREGDLLALDFPARPVLGAIGARDLEAALGLLPLEAHTSAEDLLAVLDSEQTVRRLDPDIAALGRLPCRGVIVTARGDRCDFVSRFFAPRVGIPEDPVTGSAHCVLIPYWAAKLGKGSLHAFQVSRRGGELFCENRGGRVAISGRAALYLEGTIRL